MKSLQSWFSNLKVDVIIQIVLTTILILVFIIAWYMTIDRLDAPPKGIMMPDDHMEMYDPYARAKDLLSIIIPLVTTVLSFWLGLAIQERKVSEARTIAEEQRLMREKSDQMMAKIEGRMMAIPENDDLKDLRADIQEIMGGKEQV